MKAERISMKYFEGLLIRIMFLPRCVEFSGFIMEDPYNDLPITHTIGSVPAVVSEEKKVNIYTAPRSDLQTTPHHQGGDGYQNIASSSEGGGAPPAEKWQGAFSISSYTQYFNVDTDVVLDRAFSSLDPLRGDFFSKINANPDLYGLVWVSTTPVFAIASLGNLATYFRHGSPCSFMIYPPRVHPCLNPLRNFVHKNAKINQRKVHVPNFVSGRKATTFGFWINGGDILTSGINLEELRSLGVIRGHKFCKYRIGYY